MFNLQRVIFSYLFQYYQMVFEVILFLVGVRKGIVYPRCEYYVRKQNEIQYKINTL